MYSFYNNVFRGKKIFITGHTGFKGSWLSLFLEKLGASICGYAMDPPTQPNHYNLLSLNLESHIGDILDYHLLQQVMKEFSPEIVFHLAAQPIVRLSYEIPRDTFEINIIGTVNILDIARKLPSVRIVIIVTSDKCYENQEWVWGYREKDPMGGHDPYSSSKGCAELVTACFRDSFFHPQFSGNDRHVKVASVRSGNVIGGGDWATDRLVPDIVRATTMGKKVAIRNPYSIRPWQHVLDPLNGYLNLCWRLIEGKKDFDQAWNFGPENEGMITVGEVVIRMKELWNKIEAQYTANTDQRHEASLLKLDCSKANSFLQWKQLLDVQETIQYTVNWYKSYYELNRVISHQQLNDYLEKAVQKKVIWAS
jgi:CDP-glucose 4,6-dehydratase